MLGTEGGPSGLVMIVGTAMKSDPSTHFCKTNGLQFKKDTCDELIRKAGKGPLPSTPKAASEGLRETCTPTFTAAVSTTATWWAGHSNVQRQMNT